MYTHGYGAVAAAANEVNIDQPSYVLSGIPPHGRAPDALDPKSHRRVLRRGRRRLRDRRHQGRRAGGDERPASTKATTYTGDGRREGVELPAQERARAAVRRLEPVGLGPGHEQLACHLHPRRQAACADHRAVPQVRLRPVPGRGRRAHPVGARRVHDHRTTTRTRSRSTRSEPAGQRARHRLQLRAQLGEGDRRRVRRHRALLRRRPHRSDHQDVPQGVPGAVPGHQHDARRPARRTSATRRTSSARRPSSTRCTTSPIRCSTSTSRRSGTSRRAPTRRARRRSRPRSRAATTAGATPRCRVGEPDRSALSHDGVTAGAGQAVVATGVPARTIVHAAPARAASCRRSCSRESDGDELRQARPVPGAEHVRAVARSGRDARSSRISSSAVSSRCSAARARV